MLENLLGGLIDKEQMTRDTIKGSLETVAQEMNCKFSDLLYVIKPIDKKYNFRIDVYVLNENGVPIPKREITLKEILG